MTCKYCSQPLNDTDKFCIKCGAEVSTSSISKTKSKLTYFNIASIAIMIVMLILQFLPWINICGESHSVPYWLTQMYYIRSDLPFFIVIYLLIWLYSCFTIPAIIMIIVKKDKVKPIFSWLVSVFAILSAFSALAYGIATTGPYVTLIPTLLILCSFANILMAHLSKPKNEK